MYDIFGMTLTEKIYFPGTYTKVIATKKRTIMFKLKENKTEKYLTIQKWGISLQLYKMGYCATI